MNGGRWALLLVVLICAGSCVWWRLGSGDGTSTGHVMPAAAPPTTNAAAAAPSRQVVPIIHLAVLNGTDVPELAGRVGLLVNRAGCVAERIGNAPHERYEDSLLVNRRLDDREVARLAARLGGPRVLREWDPRALEDAVLVLGADHARIEAALQGTGVGAAQ